MAKSGILSAYKYSGKNLTPFQKSYNKAVGLTWRRIKYMNKKYGLSMQLPSPPPTIDDEEIEKAISRLENIRTEVVANPTKRKEYINSFIDNFINDLTGYSSYVDQSSKYQSMNDLYLDRGKEWADKIRYAVETEIRLKGATQFYNYVSQPDTTLRLNNLAQEIYTAVNYDRAQSKATGLFNQFLTVLHGEPISMSEMIRLTGDMPEEDSVDYYQDLYDIDTFDEQREDLLD